MVILLQKTLTSLVHTYTLRTHAGRTQGVKTDKKQLAFARDS
jgi:hypothetical protein